MRSKLGALAGIQSPLEQRAENRRVDLRPVEVRRRQHRLDVGLLQRQRRAVIEQPAVEPVDRLEADPPPGSHHPEQIAGKVRELRGVRLACSSIRVNMWPGSRPTSSANMQKTSRLTKCATKCGSCPRSPQGLRDGREGLRRLLGERLPGLARSQPLGVRKRPLESIARRGVRQVVQAEFVGLADAVRPVGADAEPQHVGDDQQRRVFQRQRVESELTERGVEVGPFALVLPRKVVVLPDIGPAVAAGVLPGTALEAVCLAGRVGLGRRRLTEQPAQVDEVLLRSRALLQLGGAPLGDKLVRCHGRIQRSR